MPAGKVVGVIGVLGPTRLELRPHHPDGRLHGAGDQPVAGAEEMAAGRRISPYSRDRGGYAGHLEDLRANRRNSADSRKVERTHETTMAQDGLEPRPRDRMPRPRPMPRGAEAEERRAQGPALRALAEMENLRKRAGTRERRCHGNYAITKFARDMLSVTDNLCAGPCRCCRPKPAQPPTAR